MKTYYKVPRSGKKSKWQHILDLMPKPTEFEGLVWKERIILSIKQPIYKNPKGQNINVCRSNTKSRNNQVYASFVKGIAITEQPPKVVGNSDLLDLKVFAGHGREKIKDSLGYLHWPYDRYEFDKDDYTDHICKCGSSNCIGYIISSDDWSKFKRYKKKQRLKSGR